MKKARVYTYVEDVYKTDYNVYSFWNQKVYKKKNHFLLNKNGKFEYLIQTKLYKIS